MIADELSAAGAISNEELGMLMSLASLLGILIACLLAILAWWGNNHKLGKKVESHLGIFFFITLLLGFALYCTCMLPDSEATPWQKFVGMMGVAPMAMVHAISMFLLQGDTGEITEICHNNWIFTSLFSITHTAAACISTTVIIRHFGFSLIAKLRTLLLAQFGKSTEELFVFWGTNDPSYQLSKDIRKEETKSYRIVFVCDKKEDKNEEEEDDGIQSKMMGLLKMPAQDIQHFKELGCLITQPRQRLSSLRLKRESNETYPLIAREMQMRDLTRLIRKTTGTVHVFFLGDDETSNLRSITHLQHDELIMGRARLGLPVKIYTRAETTYVSQAVNDSNREPNLHIQMIDVSEHSIHFLKSQPQYHPIRYVELDADRNPGTVKSPFHSMLIGFGWTGQEALRFLYEYGAFVDSRSTVDEDMNGVTPPGERAKVFRSPFLCDVVDPCMEEQANVFFADYPAMKPKEGEVRIQLHNTNTESEAYSQLIERSAQSLNYVVVATGKDDVNLDIAIRLFSHIRKVRRDMSRLNIFVQCTSANRAFYFRSILKHYNQKGDTLVLFCTNEMIFTYNHIIRNEYELLGRLYNESYCRVNRSPENYWKERREKLVKKGTLDALSSLHRKEWEDCQNAYHAATKAYLYEQTCPKVRPVEELLRLICGDGHECNFRRCVPYPTTDEVTAPMVDKPIYVMNHDTQVAGRVLTDGEDTFLRNLARLEHLRWNASHEALGYIALGEYVQLYGDDFSKEPYENQHTCSELRRCHNCIIGWEELDRESTETWNEIVEHDGYRWLPDYKLADFGVVANSLYHSFNHE